MFLRVNLLMGLLAITMCTEMLHVIVVESCVKCVKVWKSGGMFIPELNEHIQNIHKEWTNNKSVSVTDGYKLEFLNDRDAPKLKVITS
jgi:hypothetical protein